MPSRQLQAIAAQTHFALNNIQQGLAILPQLASQGSLDEFTEELIQLRQNFVQANRLTLEGMEVQEEEAGGDLGYGYDWFMPEQPPWLYGVDPRTIMRMLRNQNPRQRRRA